MKLNVMALGITAGVLWGLGLFLMTWWLIVIHGATGEPTWIGRFYLGYRVSPVGSVVGLLWAVPDGLIGGALFAWLYNRMVDRCTRGSTTSTE